MSHVTVWDGAHLHARAVDSFISVAAHCLFTLTLTAALYLEENFKVHVYIYHSSALKAGSLVSVYIKIVESYLRIWITQCKNIQHAMKKALHIQFKKKKQD